MHFRNSLRWNCIRIQQYLIRFARSHFLSQSIICSSLLNQLGQQIDWFFGGLKFQWASNVWCRRTSDWRGWIECPTISKHINGDRVCKDRFAWFHRRWSNVSCWHISRLFHRVGSQILWCLQCSDVPGILCPYDTVFFFFFVTFKVIGIQITQFWRQIVSARIQFGWSCVCFTLNSCDNLRWHDR